MRFKGCNRSESKNVTDAMSTATRYTIVLWGIGLYTRKCVGNKVVAKLNWFGLIFFLIWGSILFYVSFKSAWDNESVIKAFFDTKLREYGDAFEKITSFMYTLYLIWKINFDLGRNTHLIQDIVNIDNALAEIGVYVDYKLQSRYGFILAFVQSGAVILRILSVYGTLLSLGENIPYAKITQIIITDAISFSLSMNYCIFMLIIATRYKKLNEFLSSQQNLRPEGNIVLFRRVIPVNRVSLPFERAISVKKIRKCAMIYSKLYGSSKKTNAQFGLALSFSVFLPNLYMIINNFYLLEATAAGLFHDTIRYINFLVYITWGIGYNVLIVVLKVQFSENTVAEAKEATTVVHNLLNCGLSEEDSREVLQLSIQLLHQMPQFTANGLINIDYALILECATFQLTFMGLLLQFAT